MANITFSKVTSVWALYHPSTIATMGDIQRIMYAGDKQIHVGVNTPPSVIFTKDAVGNLTAKYLSGKGSALRYKTAFDSFPRFISFDNAGNVKETADLTKWTPPGNMIVDINHFVEIAASIQTPCQLIFWRDGDAKTSRVTRSTVLQAFISHYINNSISVPPTISQTYLWSIFYEKLPGIVDSITTSTISSLVQSLKRDYK